MNIVTKIAKRVVTKKGNRARDVRSKIDRIRHGITSKSGEWNGTILVRQARDAR